jgi:hypothetical protein
MFRRWSIRLWWDLEIVTLSVWTRLRSGSFDGGLRRYGVCPADPDLPPPAHVPADVNAQNRTLCHPGDFGWQTVGRTLGDDTLEVSVDQAVDARRHRGHYHLAIEHMALW